MKLVISEKQLKTLISQMNVNQDLAEQGEGEGAPESGTSSDGEKKTGASIWTSGATRGAYQIGVTKWADSYKITRGRANPLWEQTPPARTNRLSLLNLDRPTAGSDYFASVSTQNRRKAEALTNGIPITRYIYKSDDGENLFINLIKGEFEEALLDLRSVIMTPGGMATQTAIEVIFSETVVVPIVIEALNAAVLINDLSLYRRQGQEDPEASFRIIEDLLIYLTRGAFKLTGAGLKRWLKSPAGREYMENISVKLAGHISSIKASVEKLPKSGLKNFILGKMGNIAEPLTKIVSTFTRSLGSRIAKQYRRGIIMGLLVYISAEALDKLLGVKDGTTKSEIAKEDGPSDEFMDKVLNISKPKISEKDIKTAEDLSVLSNKGGISGSELTKYTEGTINLYSKSYPCLNNLYNKKLFMVVASTKDKDIFKINNKEYYDDGRGIYDTKTNTEFRC